MRVVFLSIALGFALSAWPVASVAVQATPVQQAVENSVELRECLVLAPGGRAGRSPIQEDALAYEIVHGRWRAPAAGDVLKLPDGSERKWETLRAGENGSFSHAALRGGYAYFAMPTDEARTMVLEAAGHSLVYVNGELRTGDPYSHGYVRLPVRLKAGTNDFLFVVGRGSLRAKLTPPRTAIAFDSADVTAPDLIAGTQLRSRAAIVVSNATDEAVDQLAIVAAIGGSEPMRTPVPKLLPFSVRKIGFDLSGSADKPGAIEASLKLIRRSGDDWETVDSATLSLRVLEPGQTHKRTFTSKIDGSVQYFAVVPSLDTSDATEQSAAPGLVLTLHGAGVEAIGQAACYARKPNLVVVAPTNRRPFGFDWEDWGRLDALEVLDLAAEQFGTDRHRTYLTGHSMGGHGTWHVGVTYPDRFAAIGPSAGWISMWSYAGARRTETADRLHELLGRASGPSDTLALSPNLTSLGVYVLHGDRDDNVPVAQARQMRQRLAEFHPNFAYYERPGAGHWWGNACVDWPPMFDFFARHVIPERKDITHVDFITASPGVSAWSHWVGIEAQLQQLRPSSASIRFDAKTRRFEGKTENVARLALDVSHLPPDEPFTATLDGDNLPSITWPEDGRAWFARSVERWSSIPSPSRAEKGSHRYGTFKDAFRHRVCLVYGTHGSTEENAWALSKARYDAETFWYRGNGSIDVMADREFDPAAHVDRNVVLYGNADTNAAWSKLLASCPIQMQRGRLRVAGHEWTGNDLACLFIRPRADSEFASVGVVGGSGLAGMRLTDRLPYFVSGVGYTDCTVLSSEVLTRGYGGVRAAGFFGLTWDVASGDFAFAESMVPPDANPEPSQTDPIPKTYIPPHGYVCYRLNGKVVIDGKLDDRAWQAAPWTEYFVDIEGDKRPKPRFKTRAKMLWDDTYFYFAADMEEPHVWGTLTDHDSIIFHDNDFEIFIDPDGDNHMYAEFEINALNTGWDLLLTKPYKDGGRADNSYELPGLRTAVHVDGTLNDSSDTDRGWSVEIAIPWSALESLSERPAPPRNGDQWRVNFSRVEWKHAIADGRYVKVPKTREDNWVWSPQYDINMHRPETWGYVQFATTPVEEAARAGLRVHPDAAGPTKHLLHRVYYTLRQFRTQHGRYPSGINELPEELRQAIGDAAATINMRDGGFEIAAPAPDTKQLWRIRQDGHIWTTEVTDN